MRLRRFAPFAVVLPVAVRLFAAEPIFDGRTLEGWSGNAAYWRVEDGAITGEIRAGESLAQNEFLYWSGEVHDFELTLEFRISGDPSANSGIQFRSQRQPDGHAAGYQADLDAGQTWLGRIYDEHGRALIVERGTRVSIAPDGRRWSESFEKPEALRAHVKTGDWNTYRIVAKGPHVEIWINGVRWSVLDDHEIGAADYSGLIALQLHSGRGPAKVQFRHLQLTHLGRTEFPRTPPPAPVAENLPSIKPGGANGTPLNLDFETQTLDGWIVEGEAFAGQPRTHRRDDPPQAQPTRHQGNSWIGYDPEIGDAPVGRLSSPRFKVTHPWASFLVGGGADDATRVELVDAVSGNVIHAASGRDSELMRREVVDLGAQLGTEIFVRLVDEGRSWWGHINFDDFVFHESRPAYAAVHGGDPARPGQSPVLWHLRPNPARPTAVNNAHAQRVVSTMLLTDGFQAELIAAEPDVHQPIAFAIDERGRLWVAEAHSYPNKQPEGQGKDRIVIFEDRDGDGAFETRKVFVEGLNLVSGLEVGFGGVWIGAAPELLFIADRDRDDVPDGAPEVLLDGWGFQDTHETLNSFTWGPDGWLYGLHGVFTTSHVGKPGAPAEARQTIRAGVWRYHPVRHVFEIFAHGGSNQWGIDFNTRGHLFMTHCRSFHGGGGTTFVIRNGHYWNQANANYAPFISNTAPAFAPELKNFLPASARYDSGEGGAGKPGTTAIYGGHSHVGTMIYLGDNWPAIYRDQLFTHNLHGHQMNRQINVRLGSGYETFHAGYDMLHAPDPSYIAVDLQTGPDGAVYIIDWTDEQHCHTPHDEKWDRTNGRIYRMSWAETYRPIKVDLASQTDVELAGLLAHPNEWFVRTARRLLQERAAAGKLAPRAIATMREQTKSGDVAQALRAWWTLHVIGATDDEDIAVMLRHPDEAVRAWGIQLATETPGRPTIAIGALVELAQRDPSALVRLAIASALPTLAPADRWAIGSALGAHAEDAGDRFLPRMIWFGLATVARDDIERAMDIAVATRLPSLADSIHWFVARMPRGRDLITARLAGIPEEMAARELRLLAFALQNEARLAMPAGWADVARRFSGANDPEARALAEQLSAMFGDAEVLAAMRRRLTDAATSPAERRRAFAVLKRVGDREAIPLYVPLLEERAFRSAVIPLLAGTDDPRAAEGILSHFGDLNETDRRAALNTLTSRPALALVLLEALREQRFDKKQLTALHIRQMRTLSDPRVNAWLDEVWGKVGDSSAEAKATIARLKQVYEAAPLWAYSAKAGAAVYERLCAACHARGGDSAAIKLGPDLGGTWRNGVDYFLENIVDPNAVVGADFQLNVITLRDGAVISGMVERETATSLVVRMATDTLTVPRADVKSREIAAQSLMPPGLLDTLTERETIELLKFLTTR